MRLSQCLTLVCFVFCFSAVALPLEAGSSKNLTVSAQQAIERLVPGGEVRHVSREKQGEIVLLEARVRSGDRWFEVELTPEGQVAEIESAITLDELPGAIRTAMRDALGEAQIREIERVEIHARVAGGSLVAIDPITIFEVEYRSGGRWHEAAFDADGVRLSDEHDEADDEDEDEDDEEEEDVA